ncbi:MAG: DotU family type IV/VI secretion system protein [Planctomycetes bacterium]|nr:DotU family type IV/VI secretion system protein [Planctomycetota bacterium]
MAVAVANPADLGVELVKLVCSLSQAPAPDDAEALRLKCDHLLGEFVTKAQRAGTAPEHVDAAKYAFVALIDERILSSNLKIREAWLTNPLQLKHFDSFSAGEDFYTRLEAYRHGSHPAKADVLEVYHLCLSLGFTGKLGDDRGRERRRLLIDQLAAEVGSARAYLPGQLSPHWTPSGEAAPIADAWRWKGVPVWAVPLGVIAGVCLIYVAMYAWLGSSVDAFARDFPAR